MAINKIDRVVLHEDVLADLDSKASKQELQNTKEELQNTMNEIYQGIHWKETVATFDDLRVKYPKPKDGWTATVGDTNITYQYDTTTLKWIPTSINALPIVTSEIDGLMAKGDKAKLNTIESGAQKNLTDAQSLEQIKRVDGLNSGLDADVFQGRLPDTFADKVHNHNGEYHTKTESNTLLNAKAQKDHKHNKVDIVDFEHTHPTDEVTGFGDGVKSTILTGLDLLHGVSIKATDTILSGMGKLQKQISDLFGNLNSHEGDNAKHISTIERANWSDSDSKKHEHANKALLDSILQANINTWNAKAEVSQIPTKNSQLANDSDFATQADLGNAGLGDMLKSVYDKNNNGKVDSAESADSVSWSGVTGKPSTFTPSGHTHTIVNISNLQAELNLKANASQVLTNVPSGAIFTDTIYSHPSTHPYSMITGKPTKLSEFINDVEAYRKATTPSTNTKQLWLDTSI